MILTLIAAALLDFDSWMWSKGYEPTTNRDVMAEYAAQWEEYRGWTNRAERIRGRRRRPDRDKLKPAEAFREFCRGNKVALPKDKRPKPYEKEAEDRNKRRKRK